ncbi:MAG: hypothetical protein ACXWCG_09315, partial [Flavitalea sp.]
MIKAINTETNKIEPGALPTPSNAHRKPSTTPTIGLIAYRVRHCSGTMLLGYAIGVKNIQNW